jgi:hypothetical protein
MASSASTSADYDDITGPFQHIGQNAVPRTPLGEIEAAGTVKFFQIAEFVGILWIDKSELFSVCKMRYNVEPLAGTYLQPLDCVRITARYREEDKGLQRTLRQKHTQVGPHCVVLKGILVTFMISVAPRRQAQSKR